MATAADTDMDTDTQERIDIVHMREALALADRMVGRTWPNPAVGAVLARGRIVVGRGATQHYGGPHAEAVALAEAGPAARGATLYVTLEPCAHHGKNPPCAPALIAAGVARCVIATRDPNPLVYGAGIAALRAAGIPVEVGLMGEVADELNAGFFHRIRTGRPLVTAKWAMTLDGRIATRTGSSQWITGPKARLAAHHLRDRADAILAGVGTILADDPRLDTRLPDHAAGEGGPHSPLRVVIDPDGACPPTARAFDPALPGGARVITSETAPAAWREELAARGVAVETLPDDAARDPRAALEAIGGWGVNTLLVEGGSGLLGALFDAGLVDRVAAFIAPKVAGGKDALSPVGGVGIAGIAEAWRIEGVTVRSLGPDLLLEGRVAPPEPVLEED